MAALVTHSLVRDTDNSPGKDGEMVGCGNFGEKGKARAGISMYVCAHMHVHVICVCGIVHMWAHASCMHTDPNCAHVHIYLYVHTLVYLSEFLDTQVCTCICAWVFLGMYVYVCKHIQVPSVPMYMCMCA